MQLLDRFSMILNYQEDMEVVATAADGVEAYQKC